MKIGAQLFTVRDFTQTVSDFALTIKKIAEIGYQTVQLSAVGKEVTNEIAGEICKEHGISIVLTHSDCDRILHDTKQLIKEHEKMECRYVGLGAMPEKYRDSEWFPQFVKDFKEPARMIKEAGMQFMYHNHDFEFEKKKGGTLMERLLDAFSPEELGITLDTYWVHSAGCDVQQWISLCNDRISCIHLKDISMAGLKPHMAPVMEGNMNFPGIMESLKESCCEYALVEQDICRESPFICLEKSYKNLKTLGYQ